MSKLYHPALASVLVLLLATDLCQAQHEAQEPASGEAHAQHSESPQPGRPVAGSEGPGNAAAPGDGESVQPREPSPVTGAGPTEGAANVQSDATTNGETFPAVPPASPEKIAAVLTDAAADLGLTLSSRVRVVVLSGDLEQQPHWEDGLSAPQPGQVTLAGALERCEGVWWLRVVLVEDDRTYHSARLELDAHNHEVQAIRALALLSKPTRVPTASVKEQRSSVVKQSDVSQGKATLATTGAALGGYVGFALENAGGNVDTRLVYPLVALGAGVGLASALIVAEEWPLDRPSAWYVSGGGLWLTLAGVMVASDLDLRHPTDRYPFGVIGTGIGLGLSGYIVSQRTISEAEAVFSQSGALFGTIAGGFVHELVEPGTGEFPSLGVGVGAAGGWLLASLGTARWLPGLTSSRVLFADLGGFLGALVGAAAASPAVVSRGAAKPDDRRAFVGASLSGLALGAVVGYWLGGSAGDDVPPQRANIQFRAASVPESLPATPFEQVLPGFTAFTLNREW